MHILLFTHTLRGYVYLVVYALDACLFLLAGEKVKNWHERWIRLIQLTFLYGAELHGHVTVPRIGKNDMIFI